MAREDGGSRTKIAQSLEDRSSRTKIAAVARSTVEERRFSAA